ncbi:MAG TPA: alpha/beta hydrolase [Hyphomicrobiales bacterium]|nr:alpha/beta hydrolase [Hyphomicrobiales bacterium]
MAQVTTKDGVRLFSKDWGQGRTLVFVHSWATTNDIWHYQHEHFLRLGCRVVAFDRRGHGRSDQPFDYGIDALADDVAAVLDAHDVRDAVLIGHSMGCNEIVRYLARHGARRVAKVALVAPTTPCLLKGSDNPAGLEASIFQATRAGWRKDFPKWIVDNARGFFMPETSQAMVDWGVAMMAPIPVHIAVACNEALVDNDFRPDCRGIDVPTLVVHGTADLSAPFPITGRTTAALIPNAELKVYEGAPHGLMLTHIDRLHRDLEAFIAG